MSPNISGKKYAGTSSKYSKPGAKNGRVLKNSATELINADTLILMPVKETE